MNNSYTPNIAVKAAPFGRWTLRDKPPRSAPLPTTLGLKTYAH